MTAQKNNPSFKICFYLRPIPNKDGTRTIQVRIYLNHCRDYLCSTELSLLEIEWDSVRQRFKCSVKSSARKNKELDKIRADIYKTYNQLKNNPHLSIALIKTTYIASKKVKYTSLSFHSFIRDYLSDNEEGIGAERYSRYVLAIRIFEDFLKRTYHTIDIPIAKISSKTLYAFCDYLYAEGFTNRNTLSKKLAVIKNVFGAAQELGYIEISPFENFKIATPSKSIPSTLSDTELKRLKNMSFDTPRLEKVRDAFLFSCYTGISYNEAKGLTDDCISEITGCPCVILNCCSPKASRILPLLPFPYSIVKKYAGKCNGHIIPIISQQKNNAYLKEVAELCGIRKSLNYQLARNTYICFCINSGIPIESISKILGLSLTQMEHFTEMSSHNNEKEFETYFNIMLQSQ